MMHIAELGDNILAGDFIKACLIFIGKPQAANRRITGASVLSCAIHNVPDLSDKMLVTKIVDNIGLKVDVSTVSDELLACSNNVCSIQRSVIPKNVDHACFEEKMYLNRDFMLVLGATSSKIYMFTRSSSDRIELYVGAEFNDKKEIAWLQTQLLPKIVRWATVTAPSGNQMKLDSLSLVDLEFYSRTYHRLKKVHGKALVEIWPETTDPLKFVYEDIAIASYLIALWNKRYGERKPTFVDVGCGNGLVVYILNQEGYKGIGVDLRSRKIWSLYPKNVVLLEEAITPESRYGDYEWFIGNHSDELTPWIPVIAAKSRGDSEVFLLPCCAYSFFGKYQRKHADRSQYQSYLLFLDELIISARYRYAWDKMRIPSTKRTCLVTDGREAFEGDFPVTFGDFLARYGVLSSSVSSSNEAKQGDFTPREREIIVQNCTQLDKGFLHEVVLRIFNYLLSKSNSDDGIKSTEINADAQVKSKLCSSVVTSDWNVGGSCHISEIVALLSGEELLQLKNQCGGLQTLIKNHRHVLRIEMGIVRIFDPRISDKTRRKTPVVASKANVRPPSNPKPCWFYQFHPHGCPMGESCSYPHTTPASNSNT